MMLDPATVQQKILDEISKDFPHVELPSGLSDPLEYTLKLPGKRYRCFLVFMAYRLFSSDEDGALDAAVALEYFHNFTLIHDDLMDASLYRRGKPPVYKKWGDRTAILSGDLLLIKAYQKLERVPTRYLSEILTTFNEMATRVCVGQQLDLDFEKKEEVSFKSYREMIRLKTSELLAAALKIGAILGGGQDSDKDALYRLGISLGEMFQMQDDYIDAFGSPEKTGKQIGGDILAHKKTFVSTRAWEEADTHTQQKIQSIMANPHPQTKVEEMIDAYKKLDINTLLKNEISKTYEGILKLLNTVQMDSITQKIFQSFIHQVFVREG